MSQLFESLRRGHQKDVDPPGSERRRARADAVLATMGYATRRRGRLVTLKVLVPFGAALLIGVGWAAWQWSAWSIPVTPIATSGHGPGRAEAP